MSTRHDLGSGHSFTWLVADPATHPTEDARLLHWGDDAAPHGSPDHGGDTLVGIIHWHPRPDGQPGDLDEGMCGGAVLFVRSTSPSEAQRPIWELHSLDPLHLEPSILCNAAKGGCGSHGWIRDGRWVPA